MLSTPPKVAGLELYVSTTRSFMATLCFIVKYERKSHPSELFTVICDRSRDKSRWRTLSSQSERLDWKVLAKALQGEEVTGIA